MEANLVVDSCVDFNEDTKDIPRFLSNYNRWGRNCRWKYGYIRAYKKMKKRTQIKTTCAPPEDFINKIKVQANNFIVTISSQLTVLTAL